MAALEFHGFPVSPPSCAVHMTLDLLDLDYKFVNVNVMRGRPKLLNTSLSTHNTQSQFWWMASLSSLRAEQPSPTFAVNTKQ